MAASTFHQRTPVKATDDVEATDEKISVKELTSQYSRSTTSVPSEYTFIANPNDEVVDSSDPEYSIPTINFSLLTSGDPEQRSKILLDLRKACEEWGFFMVYIL